MNKNKIIEELSKLPTNETKALWMIERIEGIEKDHEQFKDKLSDTTARTINEIIEEDLTIPDKVMEFASKGELYDDLIKQFKIRMSVEEGMIDEPVKKLLKESKQEIVRLRDNIRKVKASTSAVKEDLATMSKQLYIQKRLDEMQTGNTAKQRVKKILLEGDISHMSESDIDNKIDLLIEG